MKLRKDLAAKVKAGDLTKEDAKAKAEMERRMKDMPEDEASYFKSKFMPHLK